MSNIVYPMKRWQKGEFYTRHTDIQNELRQIQNVGGAVWLPISFVNIIYKFLIDKGEHGNAQEKARNSAYVFACLCNEFYLLCRFYKLRDEFFVHNDRWNEYMIGRSAKKTGIRILNEMGLVIDHGQKTLRKGKPPFRPTIYEINLEKLKELLPQAQCFTSETWEKEQERKLFTPPPMKAIGSMEQFLQELEAEQK